MAKRIRPKEITVPDLLWMDRSLSEVARHLYCCLLAASHGPTTFSALGKLAGASHNSIVKALDELVAAGWAHYQRTGRRSLVCKAIRRNGKAIHLPTDLLLTQSLPRPAKWIWAAIRRLRSSFTYEVLMRLTGYSRNSLIKYLNLLQQRGWLTGTTLRVKRRKTFSLGTPNPAAAERERDIERMKSRISVETGKSSLGQALLAETVRLLTAPNTPVIYNGGVSFLENPRTGGLLQYDLYLAGHNLALEFQGPQHAGPTERFPSKTHFQAQQERDRLKREFSQQANICLEAIWRKQLTIPYIRDLLTRHGVPLRGNLDEVWHLVEYLEKKMALYRASNAA